MSAAAKIKPAPPTAPKPRPWSMAGSDRKSGEFNSLLSDGSSPTNSTGNTPESGDALDENSDSNPSERKSVRDMAAGINKGGTTVENKKETGQYPIKFAQRLLHLFYLSLLRFAKF